MKFKETLKELRTEKQLTHEQLAEKIGYSKAIIGFWESGKTQPTLEALNALANFFEISIDYLTGRTNETNIPIPTPSKSKNKFITIAAKSSENSIHNITIELTHEQMERLEKEFSKK